MMEIARLWHKSPDWLYTLDRDERIALMGWFRARIDKPKQQGTVPPPPRVVRGKGR